MAMTTITTTPSSIAPEPPYTLTRLGTLMTPRPGDPAEEEGVLNPASTTDQDGVIRLYPRLVARGNRSAIGRARVVLEQGRPVDVNREEVVLRADRGWERGTDHGGVEDPRITRIDDLDLWVMTYVAFGPLGPRPALAYSRDTASWHRLGPVQFAYDDRLNTDLNLFPNKDVVFFPEIVPAPDGTPSFAMLHRPMWDLSFARPGEQPPIPDGLPDERPSIWISYIPAAEAVHDLRALTRPGAHRFLAGPRFDWESLKIGAGPAPIRTDDGWLLIHHGVTGHVVGNVFQPQQNLRYAAGAMLLDLDDPSHVTARSSTPLMEPETSDEVGGTVANVVFPTAIEPIDGVAHVFYGMADAKIGVARLDRISATSQ